MSPSPCTAGGALARLAMLCSYMHSYGVLGMYPTLCNSAVAGNRSLFIRAAVVCLLSVWPQCNSCAASFGTEWPRLFRLRIRIAVGGCGLQLGMWAGRAVWASGCQRNWVKGWLFHKPSGTAGIGCVCLCCPGLCFITVWIAMGGLLRPPGSLCQAFACNMHTRGGVRCCADGWHTCFPAGVGS